MNRKQFDKLVDALIAAVAEAHGLNVTTPVAKGGDQNTAHALISLALKRGTLFWDIVRATGGRVPMVVGEDVAVTEPAQS